MTKHKYTFRKFKYKFFYPLNTNRFLFDKCLFIGPANFIILVLMRKLAYLYVKGWNILSFCVLCMFSIYMEFATRNVLLLLDWKYIQWHEKTQLF